MTVEGFFVSVISIIVIWACYGDKIRKWFKKGRALSKEEIDQMTKECIGKSQKECREIQDKYLYK